MQEKKCSFFSVFSLQTLKNMLKYWHYGKSIRYKRLCECVDGPNGHGKFSATFSEKAEKKLSQKRIARQSGVSYASVRRFESIGQISLHSLMELARVLGCLEDFNELFKTPVISDLKDYDDD